MSQSSSILIPVLRSADPTPPDRSERRRRTERRPARPPGFDDLQVLVRRCLDDDERAWEALIARYDRLIHAVIRGFRLPEADGADVYQRVVLALYQGLEKIHKPGRLASWIVTTTKRECLLELRRREQAKLASLDDHELPAEHDLEDELDRVIDVARVTAAIDELEPPYRDLLRLLFLDSNQPSYAEIADRLGIPVGSIGPSRARCLELLRRRLRGRALRSRFGPGKEI